MHVREMTCSGCAQLNKSIEVSDARVAELNSKLQNQLAVSDEVGYLLGRM